MSKNYTGLQTSKKTSSYFDSATIRFQNVSEAIADCKTYASSAANHAIKVVENGANTICFVQELFSNANNSNYSFAATFAQVTAAGLAAAAYYSPSAPVLMGALTVGAILISPYDSIECAKNVVKVGLVAGYVACETVVGLAEGTAGVISLIADNICSYDTAELIGNTNMIEYYS